MMKGPRTARVADIATEVEAERKDSRRHELAFAVRVVAGPDKEREVVLDDDTFGPALVGTSETCTLRLSDPRVSRRHLALERRSTTLRVRDLDSTNGTFVDRVRIVTADLSGGEYIRMGSSMLVVEARPKGVHVDVPLATGFGRVVGSSVEMRARYPLYERLAASCVPVVIEGETGTGKELLAESLHEMGPRAGGPFVVFDCTAVAPTLVETELFGHERGAFTGAVRDHEGVFEQANGGTLLIDEIGDLDLALQAKLLRVIERSELRRVGGRHVVHLDVRIIVATRRDLDGQVERGRFRDDLYHRLMVARLDLPPLRQRRGDVPLLARHFWEQLGGGAGQLSPLLLERWDSAPWPGNVRELRNAVLRQHALGETQARALADVGPTSASSPASGRDVFADVIGRGLTYPQARDRVLEEFEQRYLARVLSDHHGNVGKAAMAAGVGRRYFQRLRARSSR